MRNSWQNGSVIRVSRKSGDVWRYRWRENGVQRNEHVGTVAALPTKSHAEKAAERFRRRVNTNVECITVADLIAKFWRECPPDRETTAHSYRSIFKRVEAQFGSLRIDEFASDKTAVESWLKELAFIGRHPKPKAKPRLVSNLYRGQVRNLLHLLCEKAMLWGHLVMDRNPIEVIRLKNTGTRAKEIVTVTVEQYQALLDDALLPSMVKVMLQVQAALGLRVSEALGLKWVDIDFDAGTVKVKRSVVNGEVYDAKTAGSKKALPLHENVAAVLREWKDAEQVIGGWVFGSERTGMPVDRDWLREMHLKPAGERIGVSGLGFHSFRHTYRSMMRQAGVSLESQKELMRHSKIATTIDTYGGEDSVDRLRSANSKVVEMLARKTA